MLHLSEQDVSSAESFMKDIECDGDVCHSISDLYLCLVFCRNVVQPATNPYGGVICSFSTYFEFYFWPSTVLGTKGRAGHKSQRQTGEQVAGHCGNTQVREGIGHGHGKLFEEE